MTIKTNPVDSSMIAELGYDESSSTLAVKFTNGDLWHYEDVTPSEYSAVKQAESIGKAFRQIIKGRKRAVKQ